MSPPPPTQYLADWFERYIKNRDLIFRKIEEVKNQGDKVIVKEKSGKETHYYSEPFPEDLAKTADSIKEKECGILLYNTKDNFDKILKAWETLAKKPGLTIIFINPFSKIEKRWIIRPYTHNRITEPSALEQGLNSMYIMVDPTTKPEIEELTR